MLAEALTGNGLIEVKHFDPAITEFVWLDADEYEICGFISGDEDFSVRVQRRPQSDTLGPCPVCGGEVEADGDDWCSEVECKKAMCSYISRLKYHNHLRYVEG